MGGFGLGKKDDLAASIMWDTEDHVELLSAKEGHIRDGIIYITSALWLEMQASWPGVVTYVKTATDVETGEVTVAKAKSTEKGAVKVRLMATQNAAEFSFFRPLQKLNLKVPKDRQFNVVPVRRELEGVGTVWVFPMANRKSVPRPRKEEASADQKSKDGGQNGENKKTDPPGEGAK